jgi:4-hydroxybenzoate polyprenyltransferase
MIGIRGTLRTADWWASKIPPLLAVAYAGFLLGDIPAPIALPALLRLLLAILAVAGYGYVLNDVFDIDEDRRRGKANRVATLKRWQQAALLLLLASLALAPLVRGPFSTVSTFLAVMNLALPMLYSIPPIRLKERGILGLIADAMGVHVVPALFFAVSIAGLSERSGGWRMPGFIAATGFWALVAGLRGIIVHQMVDRRSDLDAGVKTFAGGIDPRTARNVLVRIIFPAELLALSILLLMIVPAAPILIGVIPLYLVFELLKVLDDWRLPAVDADPPGGGPYIPLEHNDLYELWLPLSLGIELAVFEPTFVILPVLHLFAFWPSTWRRLEDLASLTPAIRWFATGQGRAPLCIAPYSPYSEAGASAEGAAGLEAPRQLTVFVGVGRRSRSAANLFAADLVSRLRKCGLDAVILVAQESSGAAASLDRLADVPLVELPLNRDERWGTDWVAIIRFLERHAPCIYVPIGEGRPSSVTPLLSDQVVVVRVAHYNADHVLEECRKVLAMRGRVGNSAFHRVGSPLHRMAALLRLSMNL